MGVPKGTRLLTRFWKILGLSGLQESDLSAIGFPRQNLRRGSREYYLSFLGRDGSIPRCQSES